MTKRQQREQAKLSRFNYQAKCHDCVWTSKTYIMGERHYTEDLARTHVFLSGGAHHGYVEDISLDDSDSVK